MKLKNRLKAFFFRKDEPVALDLIAAEIKDGRAFLHPRADRTVTYLVRSDDIEVHLSKGKILDEEDIVSIKHKPGDQKPELTPRAPKQPSSHTSNVQPSSSASAPTDSHNLGKYKKKKFYVSLYQDEYDSLMASMKEYGYKRADFVLACVNTATKGTMEREHKKILRSHKELREEQKNIMEKQNQN